MRMGVGVKTIKMRRIEGQGRPWTSRLPTIYANINFSKYQLKLKKIHVQVYMINLV